MPPFSANKIPYLVLRLNNIPYLLKSLKKVNIILLRMSALIKTIFFIGKLRLTGLW